MAQRSNLTQPRSTTYFPNSTIVYFPCLLFFCCYYLNQTTQLTRDELMDRNECVGVLIDKDLYLALIQKHPDAVSSVIEHQMWDYLDRTSDNLTPMASMSDGYSWDRLFLPHHTKLRMKYKRTYYYAEVDGDSVIYEGERVTPNQFTRQVTGGQARNAWITIWVLRPGDTAWHLANELRKR